MICKRTLIEGAKKYRDVERGPVNEYDSPIYETFNTSKRVGMFGCMSMIMTSTG